MTDIRYEFESWVKSRNQSIERYDKFPYSYKISEINAMWEAWKACWQFKKSYGIK